MTPKEHAETVQAALLAALAAIGECREDERVMEARVWRFYESVGGGFGWSVTYSRVVGLDSTNRDREASIQRAREVVTEKAFELSEGREP